MVGRSALYADRTHKLLRECRLCLSLTRSRSGGVRKPDGAPLARPPICGYMPALMKTICYCAAVRTAARKTTALYDSILRPAGVTLAQYSLMRKVERAGTVSLTGLGRLAELDRSTIGRNVKALEALGLVRTAPAEDQREAAVRLTSAGEATLERAQPLWEEAQRRVEAALGGPEARRLRALALSF
jgi:DNA-binding MarR family transcriptional regulator